MSRKNDRMLELRWIERDRKRLERMWERKEVKEKKKIMREVICNTNGKEVTDNDRP